jgi:predicted DsbA family dithiol-disulfide isomerase
MTNSPSPGSRTTSIQMHLEWGVQWPRSWSPNSALNELQQIQQRLTQFGMSDGIHFTFGGKIGNTRDSHRLILLAKTKGLETQNRVVEELFQSYFEQNGDITDRKMLQKAGVDAELDEVEVKEWLESDKGGEQVDQEVKLTKKSIESGVPRFVIQGDHVVDGAEDPSAFLEVFGQIKSAES